MYDFDTFLTIVYVMIDDILNILSFRPAVRPGPKASLSVSELLTLCVVSHLSRFRSERDFWRFATRNLRAAFPTLPHLSQFNRMRRKFHALMAYIVCVIGNMLRKQDDLYEAVDGTAVPVRNYKRRGTSWLFGQAAIGLGHRIGWYYGFHVLAGTLGSGAITGYAVAPANAKDQTLAESYFAGRSHNRAVGQMAREPRDTLMTDAPTVGYPPPASVPYLTDKGYEGKECHERWRELYLADVITPPKTQNKVQWPKAWHHILASKRQIIETVFHYLHNTFGLAVERPHHLTGFMARLASRMACLNLSMAINRNAGKPELAFVDMVRI